MRLYAKLAEAETELYAKLGRGDKLESRRSVKLTCLLWYRFIGDLLKATKEGFLARYNTISAVEVFNGFGGGVEERIGEKNRGK